MDENIGKLSPQLFWDVDQQTVDIKRNERWLVERVLQRGSWEDWLSMREVYRKRELRKLLPSLRLDAKSENFLELYCSS